MGQYNNNHTHNMKNFVAIIFVNMVAARPDGPVGHHGVHTGVHHPVVSHSISHHQPVHHAVHHHQPIHLQSITNQFTTQFTTTSQSSTTALFQWWPRPPRPP